MLNKITLFLIILFSVMVSATYAQNVVSVTFLESQTKEDISSSFGIDAQYDVKLYRMLYETPDVQGNLDTASGLFIIPDDPNNTYPLLCYQHGTVNGRNDVPSQLEGGSELAIIFGSLGYVTTAADYLGLGTARGVHPYVHADTEASAAVDMLYAMRAYAETDDAVTLNDQVFVTGYSQGGHAAMAAHRLMELELADDFSVTAAAPMSGPFSISQAMRKFTTGDEQYLFVAYLAWTALSYQAAYGDVYEELEDIFKPNYAADIRLFEQEEYDLTTLNLQLAFKLTFDGGIIPKNMLQDTIREIVVNDGEHPIMDALRDNDVFDWAPTAPTRLFYCTADDQVTFENSILADSVMNMNGAVDLIAIDVASDQDHGGCVDPAMMATIAFFAQFQDVTVSTKEIFTPNLFKVFPNPVRDQLTIQLEANTESEYLINLFDAYGRLIQTHSGFDDQVTLSVDELTKGMYWVEVKNGTVRGMEKVIIY